MEVNYSILLSLYYKEKPEYLRISLDSIFNQTLVSDDVVLVEDGRLGDALESVVKEYEVRYPQLHVVRFEKNRGLGFASMSLWPVWIPMILPSRIVWRNSLLLCRLILKSV